MDNYLHNSEIKAFVSMIPYVSPMKNNVAYLIMWISKFCTAEKREKHMVKIVLNIYDRQITDIFL